MNVFKVVDGFNGASNGVIDCMSQGAPIVQTVKAHKEQLDKEGAGTGKKALFLTGYALLGFLENWKNLQASVMEVKDGVVEVIEGIKEPGVPDFEKEKERIDDKRRDRCNALPKKKPQPETPETPEPVTEPGNVISLETTPTSP